MKYIFKRPEPYEFKKWKIRQSATLEKYFLSDNAEKAWNELPSNPPKIKEEGFDYYSKFDLKNSLLTEQGHICGYCMKKLENSFKTTFDHIVPKSQNVRKYTFAYKNLIAVCEGKNKNERDALNRKIKDDLRHCNNKKDKDPIEISPLDKNCEKYFIFYSNGEIEGKTKKAKSTITTLGLDCKILINARKKEIQKFLYPHENKNIFITKEECKIELEKLKNETSESGFSEFYVAIYQQLVKYI